tara:strand:+ start:28 stop:408 length:381 start_codon:yes stop_codon:yes gene_type:complete
MNNYSLIILGLFLSIALNATAQIFIRMSVMKKKLSFDFDIILEIIKSIHIWYGMLCYGVSIFLWIYVLSKVQVSLAYPFQALGYIFGSFLAWYFLDEKLNNLNLIGLVFISVGLIILSIGIYNNER